MSEKRFSDKAIMVVAVILLLGTVAVFAWLWFRYRRPDYTQYQSKDDLAPVDVSGVESKAKTLLEGLKNNGGIPIPTPSGKMGRVDPFASL